MGEELMVSDLFQGDFWYLVLAGKGGASFLHGVASEKSPTAQETPYLCLCHQYRN